MNGLDEIQLQLKLLVNLFLVDDITALVLLGFTKQ